MASMDDSNFEQEGITFPDYHIPPPELTLLQRLLFRRPERYVEAMRMKLSAAAKGMGRHPTQEEVNVLCNIGYKEARTAAWATPASAMLAAALTWRGRGTYRFPFFQPKLEKFSPDVFPAAIVPHLQGRLANRMWHITRFSAYFALSSLAVSPFIRSYANTVAIVSARRDERLNQFGKDMKLERLARGQADMLPLAALIRQRETTVGLIGLLEKHLANIPTEEQIAAQSDHPDKRENLIQASRLAVTEGQSRIEEQRRFLAYIDELIEKRRSGGGGGGDDAFAQNKDYNTLSSMSSAGGYTLPREPNPAPPISYSREPPSSEERPDWVWGRKGSSSQQGSSSSNSGTFDDPDIDDASPLAPTTRSQSSVQSGSAWDRVRQASKQPLRASGGAQAQQSESEAYYTYDAVDKDKQAEKDKAQAEFDAMIEKERRGDTGRGGERKNHW